MNAVKTGKLIAQKRKEKDLTQKELGSILHVTNSTVSKWECGLGLPDISMLKDISLVLNISLDDLYNGVQTRRPNKKKVIKLITIIVLAIIIIITTVYYLVYSYKKGQFHPIPYTNNNADLLVDNDSPKIIYLYNNLFINYYGHTATNIALLPKSYDG